MFDAKFRKKIFLNLVDLDGIGETQIQSINNFFLNKTNTKITKDLISKLNIKNNSQLKIKMESSQIKK